MKCTAITGQMYLLPGNQRAVPVYFGGMPPPANLGETEVRGYEVELKFNKRLNGNLRLWGNVAITHAKDEVIDRDDPQLLDDYLKQAGFQIGQTRSHIRSGYVQLMGSGLWKHQE